MEPMPTLYLAPILRWDRFHHSLQDNIAFKLAFVTTREAFAEVLVLAFR